MTSVAHTFPSTKEEMLNVFIDRQNFDIVAQKEGEWALLEKITKSDVIQPTSIINFLGVVSSKDAVYLNCYVAHVDDTIVISSGMCNQLNTDSFQRGRVGWMLSAMGDRLRYYAPKMKKIQIDGVDGNHLLTLTAHSIMNFQFWRQDGDVFYDAYGDE